MKSLGRGYGVAKATGGVDMDRLQGMGAAARRAGQHAPPRPGGSTFGPKSRNVKQTRMKQLRAALCAFASGCGKDERSLAIGKEALKTGLDLGECLSLARSAMRVDSAQDRQRRAERQAAIKAFEGGPGQQLVNAIVGRHPFLAGIPLRAVPSPKGAMLQVDGVPDLERLQQAVSWAYSSKSSNLSACLAQSWAQMHRTVLDGQCPPCDETRPTSECLAAGCCVCTGSGKDLKKLKNKFLSEMKTAFQMGTSQRQLLVDGAAVVRFSGGAKQASAADGEPLVEQDVWLLIGLMYFKPYRPTFHRLEEVSAPNGEPSRAGRLFVKATPHQCRVDASIASLRPERRLCMLIPKLGMYTPWEYVIAHQCVGWKDSGASEYCRIVQHVKPPTLAMCHQGDRGLLGAVRGVALGRRLDICERSVVPPGGRPEIAGHLRRATHGAHRCHPWCCAGATVLASEKSGTPVSAEATASWPGARARGAECASARRHCGRGRRRRPRRGEPMGR